MTDRPAPGRVPVGRVRRSTGLAWWRALPVAVVLTFGAAGCGAGGSDGPAGPDGDSTDAGEVPTATVKVVARDVSLEPKAASAPAGTIALSYVNEGQLQHTLLIDGQEKRLSLAVTKDGDVDNGTVDLSPGRYVLYCDIPGHRAAGMEAELTVQ